MRLLLTLLLTLLLGLSVFSVQPALAAKVLLQNDLKLDIKAVYCLDESGEVQSVTGAMAAGKSVAVSSKKLPDLCNALALHLENEGCWQFGLAAAPGSAQKITFSMDTLSANSAETYPAMLLELKDDAFAAPAGERLHALMQLLQFGMDHAGWSSFAWPLPDARENPGTFVLAIAGQSWSLEGEGVVFKELVPGMLLAESVTLAAPFSNTTIFGIFEELQELSCVPRMMAYNDIVGVTTEKGNVLNPNTPSAEGITEDDLWQAVTDELGRIADSDGGTVHIMFDAEDVQFDLRLDRGAAKAILVITRKPDAAFG